MKEIDLQSNCYACLGRMELQNVIGGTAVECVDGFWDYVKKVVDFIMEYHQDIIDGFRRGWNKF